MAQIGLVLQGGGALGAYEWGVIERLLEKRLMPQIVSGVSIGAINATVLAGAKTDPLTALCGLWEDLTTLSVPFAPLVNEVIPAFGNPGMYWPRTDYYRLPWWTSFYTTAPLVETLEKHVDFRRLGPGGTGPRLILTATNVETGALNVFDSGQMQITPEHVQASGSLPPAFPPTTVTETSGSARKATYWDGGLFNNTPLWPVLHNMYKYRDSDENVLYVVDLFSNRGKIPENMPEVIERSTEILFSNKMNAELSRLRDTNTVVDFLQEVLDILPADSAIRGHPVFEFLKRHPTVVEVRQIMKSPATSLGAATDFSREAIERRRKAGYADACRQIP